MINCVLFTAETKKRYPDEVVVLLFYVHGKHLMDGWMICDFTSFSTVLQSYQDDES